MSFGFLNRNKSSDSETESAAVSSADLYGLLGILDSTKNLVTIQKILLRAKSIIEGYAIEEGALEEYNQLFEQAQPIMMSQPVEKGKIYSYGEAPTLTWFLPHKKKIAKHLIEEAITLVYVDTDYSSTLTRSEFILLLGSGSEEEKRD